MVVPGLVSGGFPGSPDGIRTRATALEGQLFGLLQTMPLGTFLSVIAMTLVAIFFVSGADAASIVMGTLSQRGTIHPSRGVVVFWGVMMGSIAALMLVVGAAGATRCPASRTSRSSWPCRSCSSWS
jgi:choline-glycine betaine transporter